MEIANRLKEEWREHHKGGCSILSGDCECHLCLIDKLVSMFDRVERGEKA